jgi:hypothetical protein
MSSLSLTLAAHWTTNRARLEAWLANEDGQERSVETMLLLGIAVAMVIAVGAYIWTKLGDAKAKVDSPPVSSIPRVIVRR